MSSLRTRDTVVMPYAPDLPRTERPQPFSSRVQVEFAALSHPGKVRSNNEDHFLVTRFGRFFERLQTNLPEGEIPARSAEVGYAMFIADGMGGHSAGEIASKLAISTFVGLVLNVPDWILRLDEESYEQEIRERATERYGQVKEVMSDRAEADPALRDFGTTMTMALSLGQSLFIAHIGDSRAYLFRQRMLCQMTRDHTLAQALADAGHITHEEIASHRLRHVLLKSLGPQCEKAQPDVLQPVTLADGDCLLLCTDGLTDMISDEKITEILGKGEAADKLCQELVEQALEAGGKDNVTVVVARYQFPSA
jgi:protein phosphatase